VTQMQRQLRTATRTLSKDAEFLGMRFEDFLEFCEREPGAQKWSTRLAYHIYRELAYI